MARRLAVNIVATHPETGEISIFEVGSTVPDWAADQITNATVWAEPVKVVPDVSATSGPPPRAGKGSGRDAWVAYAVGQGADAPPEDLSRDQIISALAAAGIPTE